MVSEIIALGTVDVRSILLLHDFDGTLGIEDQCSHFNAFSGRSVKDMGGKGEGGMRNAWK